MERRDGMRAGDADRQAVAEQLRTALEQGRLDLGEYDERLQQAYTAKTFGELDVLLKDLPDTTPASQQRLVPRTPGDPLVAGADGRYPHATARWLAHTWDGYFGTVAVVVAIWAVICLMAQEWLYFWPGWVAGPWGAVLLVSTIGGLATGEPQKWAGEKARKRQRKLERQERGEDPDDD